MRYEDLDTLPTVVSIMTAARALGLSRTYAYELAKRGDFPCRIIRIGTNYRVPTAELRKRPLTSASNLQGSPLR
ncbi:helix-turn-helix domain-containing protein [Actinomadura sp. 7K534]|uniref:helix-turn-helix domain-containing protein n=1 Tax=Actinomadura sp. 7K534 TaxID=2530366 RepID=UPI00105225C6|nr:helix-turn-helix domain-containing protein [Actinomadura sp. 7K534]TDB86296.1 DNA-binding protein [Actinomadura sp. 7K534]